MYITTNQPNRTLIEQVEAYKGIKANDLLKEFKQTGNEDKFLTDLIYLLDSNYAMRDTMKDYMNKFRNNINTFEFDSVIIDLENGQNPWDDLEFSITLENLYNVVKEVFNLNINVYNVWDRIRTNFVYESYKRSGSTGRYVIALPDGYHITTKERYTWNGGL